MKITNKIKQAGYTLIELLITIGLFVTVIIGITVIGLVSWAAYHFISK